MPNSPYLDSSTQWRIKTGNAHFHEPRFREVAEAILDSGLATEVLSVLGSGKEADVYLARAGTRPLVVKFYRYYRTNRRGGRPVKASVHAWSAAEEFEMLDFAHRNNIRVPTPFRREESMFSMEYLGDEEGPAPPLQYVHLDEPEPFFRATMRLIEESVQIGLVHSDLSAFNILVHQREPWLIDLASALRVDRLGSSPMVRLTEAKNRMTRGLQALANYFAKYGLVLDVEAHVEGSLAHLDRFGVFDTDGDL